MVYFPPFHVFASSNTLYMVKKTPLEWYEKIKFTLLRFYFTQSQFD